MKSVLVDALLAIGFAVWLSELFAVVAAMVPPH
jgi:hypothetical protein